MPMDIRSFFGQKPAAGTTKKATTTKDDIDNEAKAKQKVVKSKKEGKKPEAVIDIEKSSDDDDKGPQTTTSSKKKKQPVIEDDDDSDTDDGKGSFSMKPIANKKRKTNEDEKEDREEEAVSPKEFFAKAASKSPAKKTKEEISPPPRRSSPRKASVKKRIRDDDSEDDEDGDDDFEEDYKDEPVPMDEDEDDEIQDYVEKVKPKKSSPPPKVKSPPPKAKARAKVTPKKSPSVAPAKRARKTTTTPEKKKPLEPSLDLDSFDVEAVRVSEFLQGLTFVFTGVLDNMHRDDAFDLIKTLGGRVTGSVSGKTNYLVVGETLEDGRPYHEGKKYQMAKEKSIPVVMGEKRLYGLCHLYHEQAKKERGIADGDEPPKTTQAPDNANANANAKPTPTEASTSANPYAKKVAPGNPYAKAPAANPYAKASNPYASKAAANPYASRSSANPYGNKSSAPAPATDQPAKPATLNQLWVDRHAPRHTREILGNKDNVNKLAIWLNSWERTFNNPKANGKTFSNPRGPWKAALLSGPPGIGKTTTATLVAKEAGRDLLEFNASDARSKKALQNNLGDVTGSQTLNFGAGASLKQKQAKKLRCIVMDEVDGMGAGDRSGMAELIQMIKKSKVPIICICNDRQSQKMKSLLPYCMDLRYKRPTKSVMATRAVRIAQMEGLQVERNAAEAIAESCGNDVRQVLNVLQMWAQKGSDNAVTYKGLKEREKSINKDEMLRVSLFDAAKSIMEGRRNLAGADVKTQKDSLYRRSDAFFVDYSFVGLLVQQNYPKVMQGQHSAIKRTNDPVAEQEFLERMHKAADSMSDYAVVENSIRTGDQNWSLLPTSAMLTVATGYHAGGESGGMLPGYPEFTAWMGKNSSKGKKMRLLQELHYHMNFKISGDGQAVRQSYLPVLRQHLMQYFKSDDKGASKQAIALMDDYGLSRDDVMEKLDEFRIGKDGPAFADLESKQKAAFTREYNSGSHKSQALVAEQGGGNKTKKLGGKGERQPQDLDAIDEDHVEEESEGEDEAEELKKLQEKFKKKGRKKSAGTSKKKKSK